MPESRGLGDVYKRQSEYQTNFSRDNEHTSARGCMTSVTPIGQSESATPTIAEEHYKNSVAKSLLVRPCDANGVV